MKRILLTIYTLLLTFTGYAQYSEIAALSSILLEEKEDSLHIEMAIMVHSHSVNPYQSLTIIPELSAEKEKRTYTFPEVLINGKKKARFYNRNIHFNYRKDEYHPPYMRLDINRTTDTILVYNYSVPYELWMDTASLKVHQILAGCADSEKRYTLENKARVKIEPMLPYQPQIRVNYIAPLQEPKHRNVQETAFLDFKVGQSVILSDFRRNPVELSKIKNSVTKVYSDKDVLITGIQIQGHASPDGSYATNERLSLARARALKLYISQYFDIPGSLFQVTAVAEDWDGLRKLVEENYLPDQDRILHIIDSDELPDRKEQRLKALGRTYTTLLNDYFPQLRRVKYRINYIVRDYSIEETEVLLQRNPENLSPFEIFMVAEKQTIDSEEWHALLQKSAELYPDDPIVRINAAASLLVRGDYESAGIHLMKVANDPRAYNNIGAYYLLAGDPGKAEEYLKKANLQDIKATVYNLQEVELLRKDIEKERKETDYKLTNIY